MTEKPLDLEINFTEPRFWITRDEPDFEEIMKEIRQRINSAVQGLLKDIWQIDFKKLAEKEKGDMLDITIKAKIENLIGKWFGEVIE